MENIQVVYYIVSAIVGLLTAGIPALIALIKSIKARAAAKTAEQKATADLAIKNHMFTLITEAEEIYAVVDTALKAMGGSAGAVKKETVLCRLHQFAIDNKVEFDKEKWSVEIDEAVAMTKSVNCKK